jgi:hypothetical protein
MLERETSNDRILQLPDTHKTKSRHQSLCDKNEVGSGNFLQIQNPKISVPDMKHGNLR